MGLENPLHIAFVLVIVLLVFGAKRVPEVGRSLGKGIREFKGSLNELDADDRERPPRSEMRAAPPDERDASRPAEETRSEPKRLLG
jgi:sec-independent protein translocase protein TatA